MLRSIVNLVRAFIQWIWRTISQPWIRNTIIGLAITITLVVLIASGYSFATVYPGMIGFLIIFGILSFWVAPLRGILIAILVAGALFYFGDEIIFDRIIPTVNNFISKNLSNFPQWKETRKELANNKLAEKTISAKKEIIDSETVKGTFGILTKDSVVYDEHGSVMKDIRLKKDQRVMSLGLKSMAQAEDPKGGGTEGMILVSIANKFGDFVQSRSGYIPIRKIQWDNGPVSSSADTGWIELEKKIVDFSRVEVMSITPEEHIATIPLPISIGSGNYRIKLQGNYDFFLGNRWISFPWQGDDQLVAFPSKKEFSELQNGAVVILKGAENITPMSTDGAVINLSGKIDKLTIKINTFFKYKREYIHPLGGFILRNSYNKPLTITIEKEV